MKRFVVTLIVLLALSTTVFAAPDDVVPIQENVAFQIAATLNLNDSNNILLSAMKGMSSGYASKSSMNEFAIWLKIELAQSGSMNKEYPDTAYQAIIASIVGYNYGNPSVHEDYLPPVCVLDGSNITCDEDPTGKSRDVLIFAWDYVDFTEGAAGSFDSGWTFTSLSSGTNYVCAYDTWDTVKSLPTRYIQIP